MKLRRLVFMAAVVVLVVSGLALFTNLFGGQLIPGLPLLQLGRTERFATSSITLGSVRELSSFATVRYVHKAVFPYDYLPAGVSLNEILRKLRTSNATARDTLTEAEYRFFRTWSLASEVDLSTTGGTFDFVVVSLVITAGYDERAGVEEIVISEEPDVAGGRRTRATVLLADPVITDVAVEDIDSDDYPYPDTALSADGWRRVADYVREQSVEQEVLAEILATARENGEAFVLRVLEQAGFDEVVVEAPDAG